MKLYDFLQWSVVFGVVLISVFYVLGLIAPQWRKQLAQYLQQPNHARWVNQIGLRIAGGAGCGACDSCGTCAPQKPLNKNA